MSLFAKVEEVLNVNLQERFEHLKGYALSFDMTDEDLNTCIDLAGLNDGITELGLADLQIKIEIYANRRQMQNEIQAQKRFEIDCDEHLDWYLGRRHALEAELELVEAQMQAEMKRIQTALNGLNGLFEEQAEQYHTECVKAGGKKTKQLPHGGIQLKTFTKDTWAIEDESKLQDWCSRLSVDSKTKFGVYPAKWARDTAVIKNSLENGEISGDIGYRKTPAGDRICFLKPKGAQ